MIQSLPWVATIPFGCQQFAVWVPWGSCLHHSFTGVSARPRGDGWNMDLQEDVCFLQENGKFPLPCLREGTYEIFLLIMFDEFLHLFSSKTPQQSNLMWEIPRKINNVAVFQNSLPLQIKNASFLSETIGPRGAQYVRIDSTSESRWVKNSTKNMPTCEYIQYIYIYTCFYPIFAIPTGSTAPIWHPPAHSFAFFFLKRLWKMFSLWDIVKNVRVFWRVYSWVML